MPIKITCRSCHTTLRAPDTAAGKKIKCPKCGNAVAVSAAKVAEDVQDETVQDTSTKTRRPAAEKVTSAANGNVRRPKRRSDKRGKGQNRMLLGLGVGGVAVLLLAVLGYVLWTLTRPDTTVAQHNKNTPAEKPKPAAKQAARQAEPEPEAPSPPKVGFGNPARGDERISARNKLKQIGIAIQNFQGEASQAFMPTLHGRGKLSWRVAILPQLEQRALYGKFKLDEAWDSEHNLKVLEENPMPAVFAPERDQPGEQRKTYLQLFTGAGTCFPTADSKLRPTGLARGITNTILLAEARTPVEWTRPSDLEVKDGKLPPLGGVYVGDFFVMCVDANSYYLQANQFADADILALINPSSAQPVAGWPPD
jgi:hypothetical protein